LRTCEGPMRRKAQRSPILFPISVTFFESKGVYLVAVSIPKTFLMQSKGQDQEVDHTEHFD
jgi:hypothetical protein